MDRYVDALQRVATRGRASSITRVLTVKWRVIDLPEITFQSTTVPKFALAGFVAHVPFLKKKLIRQSLKNPNNSETPRVWKSIRTTVSPEPNFWGFLNLKKKKLVLVFLIHKIQSKMEPSISSLLRGSETQSSKSNAGLVI